MAAHDTDAVPPGTSIGRYVVREHLGSGGMGVVYAADDPDLGRRVALKLVLTTWGRSPTMQQLERIQREAQAMAKVAHPSVVPVYDIGAWLTDTGDQHLYIAMELVEGRDAAQWLAETPRAPTEIFAVFLDIARGLAAAHRGGIVHRDFKPSNVIVGDDGRARVTDFGLAITEELGSTPASGALPTGRSGAGTDPRSATAVVGTPGYMAPEQRRGEQVDARADQYSFCVALHEALYGVRPPPSSQVLDDATGIRRAPVCRNRVPRAVWRVLCRGLAPDPDKRWRDLDAVVDALTQATRPRRRGIVLAAAAFATVIVVAAPSRDVPCATGEAAFAQAWGPDTLGRIERERARARGTDAAKWDVVSDALRRRVDAYATLLDETCTQADARHRRLAMRCLGERRAELRTIAEVLRNDATVDITRLEDTVSGLADVDRCADTSSRAEEAYAAAGLREGLAEADVLFHMGRLDAALARVDSLLAEGDELEGEPLLAELYFERGAILETMSEFEAAEESLSRAYFAALTSAADSTAFEAARVLVFIFGEREGDHEAALHWARYARSSLDRLGTPPESEAQLLNSIGAAHQGRRKWVDATAAHRRALELRRRTLPPGDPDIAVSLNNLGNTLVETGAYDEAMEHHREAQRIWAADEGAESTAVAMSLLNQGNVEHLRHHNAEARRLYTEALAMYERIVGPEDPRTARAVFGLAQALYRLRETDEALVRYQQAFAAWEARLGPDNPSTAFALGPFARALADVGDLESASAALRRGIELRAQLYGPEHAFTEQLRDQLRSLENAQPTAG
jgi:tetratricopeptide (TPR) repeat protein